MYYDQHLQQVFYVAIFLEYRDWNIIGSSLYYSKYVNGWSLNLESSLVA